MSESGAAPGELLAWDTEFFGCRIGRVLGDSLTQEQATQVDEWSRKNRIQCLYFLSRADDPATIQNAGQNGFGLVDIRVTFESAVTNSHGSARPALSAGIRIRPFQSNDLPGL